MVLGLTFLLVGLTFAFPFRLVPGSEVSVLSGRLSPEVANVYACVAWAGWAHFLYAFRGQGGALLHARDEFRGGRLHGSAAVLVIVIAVLLAVRSGLGVTLFGAVVWIYFIDHFLKAEQLFDGRGSPSRRAWFRWLGSAQALLSFTWLSIVLLDLGRVNSHPWLLWSVSVGLGAAVLAFGGWRALLAGDVRGPLLALFFVAEALVWGTFSRYGGPVFLTGVYVFHIAAGSYFHYLGSYFVGHGRSDGRDRLLQPIAIVAINVAVIAVGCGVAYLEPLRWFRPLLGIEWFTLWVAVHLVASDLFPAVKRWRNPPQREAG